MQRAGRVQLFLLNYQYVVPLVKLRELTLQTLKLLFQLFFFKNIITKLPFSWSWLIGITLVNFAILIGSIDPQIYQMLEINQFSYALALLCSYALLLGGIYLLLKIRKHTVRFVKTGIAYMGADTIFHILVAALVLIFSGLQQDPLFFFLIFAWYFGNKAFIIKNSLETNAPISIILVINLEVIRLIPIMMTFIDFLTDPRMT